MVKCIHTKLPEWAVTTLSVLLIAAVIVALYLLRGAETPPPTPPVAVSSSDIQPVPVFVPPLYIHSLQIGNQKLAVAYAITPNEQSQGLSGTDSLPAGRGMLFMFPTDASIPFWMKDMRYGLDIIWISADKEVVDISANLLPSSYPNSFEPKVPVRYVLEVPAGFAEAHGIVIGTKVSF